MNEYIMLMEKFKRKLIMNGEDEEYIYNLFKKPQMVNLDMMKNLNNIIASNNIIYDDYEMEELKNYKIPHKIIGFYEMYMPNEGVDLGADVGLLSLENIKRENIELSPGSFLIKYGILTFASTTGGNAICMDLNVIKDGEPQIIIADHSIFNGRQITIYENGVRTKMELSYEAIKKYTVKVSDTFTEFLKIVIDEIISDIEDLIE